MASGIMIMCRKCDEKMDQDYLRDHVCPKREPAEPSPSEVYLIVEDTDFLMCTAETEEVRVVEDKRGNIVSFC